MYTVHSPTLLSAYPSPGRIQPFHPSLVLSRWAQHRYHRHTRDYLPMRHETSPPSPSPCLHARHRRHRIQTNQTWLRYRPFRRSKVARARWRTSPPGPWLDRERAKHRAARTRGERLHVYKQRDIKIMVSIVQLYCCDMFVKQ